MIEAYVFVGVMVLMAGFIAFHHFSSKKRHNETKNILTAPAVPEMGITADDLQEVHDRLDDVDGKWDEHKAEVMEMLEDKLGVHIEKWEEMGKDELAEKIEERIADIEDKMDQHRIDMEAHRIEMAEHKQEMAAKKSARGGTRKARGASGD